VELWLHSPTNLHSAYLKHKDCIIFTKHHSTVVDNSVLSFPRLIILTVFNMLFLNLSREIRYLIILK